MATEMKSVKNISPNTAGKLIRRPANGAFSSQTFLKVDARLGTFTLKVDCNDLPPYGALIRAVDMADVLPSKQLTISRDPLKIEDFRRLLKEQDEDYRIPDKRTLVVLSRGRHLIHPVVSSVVIELLDSGGYNLFLVDTSEEITPYEPEEPQELDHEPPDQKRLYNQAKRAATKDPLVPPGFRRTLDFN